MLETVRHRTASGSLEHMWEFDVVRGVVILVFRLAKGEPIEIDVPVCHPRRARLLAFPILRRNEHDWALLPERFEWHPYEHDDGRMDRVLVPTAHRLHERLTIGDQIMLRDAPPEVSADLAALERPKSYPYVGVKHR